MRPSPQGSTVRSAPASASISSVWVRVVTASRTMVVPLGRQPGEEDGRLHLGTGHPGRPVDAVEVAAPDPERGQAAGAPAAHVGAHEPEGLGHPVHGAGRERLVAHQPGLPGEPGHEPRQQAHGGPRVAAVERPIGLVQAGPPPVEDDRAVAAALHARAHGLHRSQGRGHVGAVGEPVDERGALGERAQQDGPVRDGLLARRAHACRGTARHR